MNATLQKKKLQSELDKAILNVKEGNVKNFDTLEDMMSVYTNLKVYHFLIKKCTTPNRLQRYA